MKKVLVFVATFVMVLGAGAAFAFMTTPGEHDVAHVEKPKDLEVEEPEKEEVEAAPEVVEVKEEAAEEEPKAEPEEEPKEEEPKEEEPKEEDVEEEEDTTPPHIEITFPEDGQHFEESKIAFEGVTEPGARVFAGKYEADVDEEGHWRIVLILSKGGNTATLVAVDEAGNEAAAKVQAFYDPPAEEEKDEPNDDVHEFSAHQKFGSCAEDPPYDVWYGTGEPGTTVHIASEFGSASTTIGEKGNWDLKVEFHEAPCGEAFEVVLETNESHRLEYEFIRLCESEGGHDK